MHERDPTTMHSRRQEISNYREDCEKLDRDQRLHDSLSIKKVC